MPKIDGGYILLSKKIVNNEIMKKPPEYLKTWIYLLSNANYDDDMPKKNLKRGQGFVNINELREFLSYHVGFRLEKPSRKKVWAIVEWLRNPNEGNNEGNNEGTMIETTKVTHGMTYKVLNYAVYQNPKNYERNNESTTKETTNAQRREHKGNNKLNEYNELNELNELKEEDTNTDPCPYSKIINYLNEKTGKGHSPKAKETRKKIKARWNEGYGLEDFIKAIDNSYEHWSKSGDLSNMKPSTLFNGKFGERVTNDAYGWKKEEKYNPMDARQKRNAEATDYMFEDLD